MLSVSQRSKCNNKSAKQIDKAEIRVEKGQMYEISRKKDFFLIEEFYLILIAVSHILFHLKEWKTNVITMSLTEK